ncbi:Carboxyl-terminal-processing peptidase 2 [Hibiscus syriacus]|uniref:Carboxyl-terminal-processing peptidase 2 n=1 Tax=Hibiscus syriacus TaxID=106335 RepID=A0A6A3BWZ8_HIBSY|nr:Carboxyl-terminal-processing peptidase 2 [Hibiscus syriacus]
MDTRFDPGRRVVIKSFRCSKQPTVVGDSEDNLLFLEAWRTIDRAYIEKTFNGQNTAIRKMLATLNDPFTRFLEPEKFKSLRCSWGTANQAGISSGDIILQIDNTSTESMGIYDAAERLQGPEGSSVELTIQSGPIMKHLALTRAKVSLNPVKLRLCEVLVQKRATPESVYIKLTSFNKMLLDFSEKPSCCLVLYIEYKEFAFPVASVKEAIDALRSNSVNAFVGGLFPEGIETAKIWLDEGVIVYICDNRGVRDIYDTDGSSAIAASEPLAVLVNKGTASASEILASALKDNKRAVLFGEPTYGKGKIQSVFQLSDGSGLAVTVARYETTAHNDIDKVGVIPDHPLPNSFLKDDDGFCGCLQDSASARYVNNVQLFSR